jgi:hypothetical protein
VNRRFRLTIKQGIKTLYTAEGLTVDADLLFFDAQGPMDPAEQIIRTEQLLERLLGLRFHIDEVQT